MRARSATHKARMQAITWVKQTYPDLYNAAMAETEKWRRQNAAAQGKPATLDGLGEDAAPQSFWDKLSGNLTKLGSTYLTYRTQKDGMKINLERAQQGLPPVDTSFAAPVVRTQIDVTPEIAARLQESGGEMMRKTLLFGGLGLGAVLLLTMMKKR